MSHINRKKKTLTTKRKTNRASQHDLENNTSMFESFVSVRSSKQQQEVLSSSQQASICPNSRENEDDTFAFPKKSCLSDPNKTAQTEISPQENIFDEETKVEISILDSSKLKSEEQYQLNDSSLFFESDNKKKFVPNSPVCKDSCGLNEDVDDNDDTVPIPDGSNGTKASVSETNLPEEKDSESEDNNQCPVCLKTVGVAKYLSHIKSCAAKNNLSTQQLLSALQLHKKQLAERKELGLGIPVQSYRAKVSPKRPRTNNARKGPVDSSLQLALALSASLHSAQEVEVIQEAEALKEAGLSEEAEQKLSTLEKYGFASDFPIQSTSVAGGSKCRPLPSSLLLRRTQEDRERIVTEKVAIVLITEEESANFSPFTQMEPTLKSKRLKEKWNSDCYLWRKSLCPESEERDAFYVKSLAKFVSPSKAEVGEGLRRLSQLPGRMNTPEKDEIGDLLTPSKETASNYYKEDIADLPTPLAINKGKNIDISSGHQMNSSFSSSSSLAEDWSKLVNKEVLSDIKIRCKDSVVISAHKLVFYVRCPRILDEIEKKGNDRDLLEWESVTAESVLAFLEFVYSGKTDKLLLLEDSDISSVKTIADRLGCNQLKDKLDEMQSLSESQKADVKKNLFGVDHQKNVSVSLEDYFNSGDLSRTDNSFSSQHGSSKNREEMFSNTPVNSNSRNVNCGRESPDLFADSGVTNIADDSLQEREELDILVSLIGKPTQQGVGTNKWSNDEEQEDIMVVESPLGTSKSLQEVAIENRGVSTGKRKASTISFSDDEETSLSKKHCSKNNESFENSCRDDAFDLTRDSNPPSVEGIDHGNDKSSSEGSVKCTSQNSKMENQYEEETLDLTQSSKSSDDEVCESSKQSSRMSLDELDSRDSMDDLTQKKSVSKNSKTDYCQDSDKDMSSIDLTLNHFSNSISKSQINNDQRELSDSLDDLTQKTVDESVSKNDPKSCDRLHNESHSFNVTPSKSPAKFVKDDFIGDISTLCTPETRHITNITSSKGSSVALNKSQLSKSSRSLTNTSFKEVQGDALNDGNYDQYYNDPIWDGYDDYYHFNYEAHTSFQTPIKNFKDISSTSEKSRSKPLSSPKVCTTNTSLTKALQKKLSQETSPICSSSKSIKSISSDNSEKSPHPLSQKRVTPSSSGSIKYISSSDSKSPKHLSQSLSNSPAPRKALGTCHSLSINDSEDEVVPDINSPNTLDSLKSRKNLTLEFVTESSKSKNISAEDLRHLGKDAEKTSNVRKESYLRKDSLEAMQRLLDDSFEVNNSLLDAADALASGNSGGSKSTSGDAVTAGPSSKSSLDTPSPGIIVSDKVTPLADYSAMKTPTLKKELSRFGLKPSLDRRKAKLLLRYIYDQTHPVVPDCEKGRGEFRQPKGRPPRSPRKANVAVVATGKPRSPSRSPKKPETVTLNDSDSETEETCSQMSTSSSISSSASLPEESYHEPEDILTQDLTEKGDVRSAIRKLITGDLQLHRKVLMYEPIQLEELMARLKTSGIKSKTNDVMDFLDEQCITFRTNSWKATNEKRRQKSPKKKKPQNAGPSGSPLKDKAPVVKKRGRPKKTNS